MPNGKLSVEAEDFAQRLTTLLNGTVTTAAEVTVFLDEGGDFAIVAPGAAARLSDIENVPLSIARSQRERSSAKLWLRLFFRVVLDREGEHLAVETSMFGLCINPATGFCPLRVEYDRSKTARQQAHIHVHGESGGLGYAFALAGRKPKDLASLHFPVGGRRFRPSLEDIIEFLVQEKFVPHPKQNWRRTINESRGDWEARQVRATVRRAPEIAGEQLRSMGYLVEPP